MLNPVVSLRALRSGVDWVNLLSELALGSERYDEVAAREWLQLDFGAQGVLNIERVTDATQTERGCVFNGHGAYVKILPPELSNPAHGQYPVMLSVQGHGCSTAHDGLEAVDAFMSALVSAVYPEEQAIEARENLKLGRVDLFCDVEIIPDPDSKTTAQDWLETEVYAHGAIDDAAARFSTRAHASSRNMTGSPQARTLYIGGDPRLRIYPKSRKFKKNTDLPLVKERWSAAGWQGKNEVLRVEFKVTRDWIRSQTIRTPDADTLAGPLIWGAVRPWLPVIFLALLGRCRHTERVSKRSKLRTRDDSDLWKACKAGVASWERAIALRDGSETVDEWRGPGEILYLARTTAEVRLTRALEAVAERLSVLTDFPATFIAARVTEVAAKGDGVNSTEKLAEIRREFARRMSLDSRAIREQPTPQKAPSPRQLGPVDFD